MVDIMKKSDRDSLKNAKIYNDKLYVTDGYIMLEYSLDCECESKTIRYENFERWYKLASNRDMLSDKEIASWENSNVPYPEAWSFFDIYKKQTEVDGIMLNADLLQKAQTALGSSEVAIQFGRNGSYPVCYIDHGHSKAIVMSMIRR